MMNSLFDLLLNLLRIKKGICIFFTVTLLNSLTITLKLNAFNPFDNTITGVDTNNIPITIKLDDIVSIKFSIGPCQSCKILAYVANTNDNTVSVIDTTTNSPLGSPIPVGVTPFDIAITPDGTRAYVTTLGGSSVSVIDITTNSSLGISIPVGLNPFSIAIGTIC
ncbi:hypothetical protein P4655_27535 [Priestia megaterium]|uniref:YncE family protein n=1 Tax=Priestia megaterium TaxID=1404 RepID=UPI0030C903E9